MKTPQNRGFTLIEWLIVVTLVVILFVTFAPPHHGTPPSARMTKQINNVKQIAIACQLYATDHAGQFPDGNYDPGSGTITDAPPATSAEAHLNDLLRAKKLVIEKVFWSPNQIVQCAPTTPDEDGTLTAEENCWDYISGLDNNSKPTLPLVFEASDAGKGTHWTEEGGHPWEKIVIVGYVDGSAEKVKLDRSNQAKTERDGMEVHLCVPTPGENGWPETAKLAPATPAKGWPK